MPFISVITPTYNRADKIILVYESLMRQSYTSFEWIVVDDGSTDSTHEKIRMWVDDKRTWFPIKYIFQKNGHKKKAHNTGVLNARGYLVLIADSDDKINEDALRIFHDNWFAIDEAVRPTFAGVGGLCSTDSGVIIGKKYPCNEYIDITYHELIYKYKNVGEKWWCVRRDILLSCLFPEDVLGHVPEGVVWSSIGGKYKFRYVNKVVRVYLQDLSPSSTQIMRTLDPFVAAPGMVVWKRCILEGDMNNFFYSPIGFVLDSIRYNRFFINNLIHESSRYRCSYLPDNYAAQILIIITAPLGVLLSMRDLWVRCRRLTVRR